MAHFDAVRAVLDAVGLEYRINPRLVRGLDYYNLTVFEWITDQLGSQGTVCGGGRYDGLIEQLGGKPAPAVGWGLGIERLLLLLEAVGIAPPDQAPDAYAVVGGDAARVPAMVAAEALRAAGVSVLLHAQGARGPGQRQGAVQEGQRQRRALRARVRRRGTCARRGGSEVAARRGGASRSSAPWTTSRPGPRSCATHNRRFARLFRARLPSPAALCRGRFPDFTIDRFPMAQQLDLQEQEQVDALKAFWARYGNLITWTVTLVLAAFAAWNWWHEAASATRPREASTMYGELQTAAAAGDAKRAAQILGDMKSKAPKTTYTQLGALLAAKTQADKGDAANATANLQWVADNGNDENAAVAHLRLAGLLADAQEVRRRAQAARAGEAGVVRAAGGRPPRRHRAGAGPEGRRRQGLQGGLRRPARDHAVPHPGARPS